MEREENCNGFRAKFLNITTNRQLTGKSEKFAAFLRSKTGVALHALLAMLEKPTHYKQWKVRSLVKNIVRCRWHDLHSLQLQPFTTP